MYLNIAILIFGVLIFGIVVGLQFKLSHGWGPHTTRMAGFTLLITSALFLVTTEMKPEALGAAFTLLGTIAGYLFGRKGKEEE